MSQAQADTAGPRTPDPASRPEDLKAVPVRHWGRWVGAAVVVLLVLWLISAAGKSRNIEWDLIPQYLFNGSILQGVANTLVLSVTAQLMGIVLGVVFAVMRQSENPVLKSVASFYVWLFRGTPVLVQLLVWYNLALVFQTVTIKVPFVDWTIYSTPMNSFMTPLMAALLGLGLNEGAYMAEIVRGGLLSVDEGQTEAAMALGMSRGLALRRIVLPQAMRVIIPPTGNEFISMLKTSSLAILVNYGELAQRAQAVYQTNFKVIELLFVISIWYLVLTTVATIGQSFLERRYARGSSRAQHETLLRRLGRNLLKPGRREWA
jgi:polar amino acid transport system permease protein